MPMMVLFKRDIFSLLKFNWKLHFISRFQWLMVELFQRPFFEILIHPFLPVLVHISERIPNQQGSLHTKSIHHKKSKCKKDIHELERERLLPIQICHKTHYQCSTCKLPLLQFFFISLGSLVLTLLMRHQLLKKQLLRTYFNLTSAGVPCSLQSLAIYSAAARSSSAIFSITSVTARW